MSKANKIKLNYFDVRGRGEGIRYLMAAGGIKYEDHRIALGSDEWKELKPKMPFGQLPVLEVNDQQIAESVAVGRYVANLAGLTGDTPLQQAHVDTIIDKSTQFREDVAGIFFMEGTEEKRAQELDKYIKGKALLTLEQLTKILGDKQYFVANKLSFADIWFYACYEILIKTGGKTDFFTPYPKLQALYKRVEETPKIAEYIKNRTETNM